MKDQLSIGPTPSGESCEQLGPNYNPTKARKECKAFIGQLTRTFGNPPEGARFKITSNPHDFGTYLDVVVEYDDTNDLATDFAFKVEDETPETWDTEAKQYLGI